MVSSDSRSRSRLTRFGAVITACAALVTVGATTGSAQPIDNPYERGGRGSVSFYVDDITLAFYSEFDDLTVDTARNIIDTFFVVYPQECAEFNRNCPREVTIVIRPNLISCGSTGVQAGGCTSGNLIELGGPHYLRLPQDYDLVTHEAMHVVQSGYQNPSACLYWVEGLADVARATYGVNNDAVPWALAMGPHYTAGYAATAHFLVWVSAQYNEQIVTALDQLLRTTSCPNDDFWIYYTGLGVDALWNVYSGGARYAPTTPGADAAHMLGRSCVSY